MRAGCCTRRRRGHRDWVRGGGVSWGCHGGGKIRAGVVDWGKMINFAGGKAVTFKAGAIKVVALSWCLRSFLKSLDF